MKAVECRRLALPHLRPPGEYVRIPFEGKSFAGVLRRPAGVARPPIVVMCMGLDSAKEEMDSYESLFLARGLATLSFDGPGQGESEYDIAIRGDYEVAVKAVVDWVEKRRTSMAVKSACGASASAAITLRAPRRSSSASKRASRCPVLMT